MCVPGQSNTPAPAAIAATMASTGAATPSAIGTGDAYPEYQQVAQPDKATWDKRADGSEKGTGWLGLRKRPDGNVSSEISASFDDVMGGKEIPLMVPGLTKPEMDYLMTHDPDLEKNPNFFKDMPKTIVRKAVDHAMQRDKAGKSPFRQADDQ